MRRYLGKKKAVDPIKELLQRYPHKKMLNIGCGTDYKDGWINIDNNSDNNIEKLDLYWDLRYPLPFADNSVDLIFNEHFMEHLTIEESQRSIKDFMRVLKKGGVMRIAMPDLKYVIDFYNNPSWRKEPVINERGMQFVQTRAEFVNMTFTWWGHKWLYDWEELERRIKEAGFTNSIKAKHGKSRHPDLRGLETRGESTLIAEITK
jgi:predicted SAM-dependent methyltransferase